MDTAARRAALKALIDTAPVTLEGLLTDLRRIWGHVPGAAEQQMSAALRALGRPNITPEQAQTIAQQGVIQISPTDATLLKLWSEVSYWADQLDAVEEGTFDTSGMFTDDGDGHYGALDVEGWHAECVRSLNDALNAAAAHVLPITATTAKVA
ncbi:hypothetical protein ACFFMN_22845 [Planobispora siamensis]|uniref:Uncharacterized protein n=1 Tax=Planobispora siamensis TaxID=936338 RepID=A0A8J3WN52_9ACTN|nr:hypothetical protein [Planobispora siamensis]GIH95405.1 hypothetical protein Psi01_60350 [Planobispora siamensis]